MKKIAVIGTGIMGHGMAVNFLKAGHEVAVWNRSAAKVADLQKDGATVAASPKAAAAFADIVFEVTADDASSQAVWEGESGILAGADAGKVLVASATVSVAWVSRLAELCDKAGATFFDMPLTGGRVGAETGALTLLVGGDEAKFEALKPDLASISKKQFYFGPAGSGMKYKLVLNGLQAAHIAAFGEAMELAKQSGLDVNKVGPALCDRPGGIVTGLAWEAYQETNIPLSFLVDWITKDLGYAKKMAAGLSTPLLDDVLAQYRKAQSAGHGDADWTIILK